MHASAVTPEDLTVVPFPTRKHTKLLRAPYTGGARAINDTLAGSVDAMFAVMPEAIAHIQAGKLHAEWVKAAGLTPQ